MKKWLGILLICVGLSASAQHQRGRGEHRIGPGHEQVAQLTAEQIADLQTKRATLALELNSQQAEKIYTLNLEQARKLKQRHAERETLKKKGKAQGAGDTDGWYERQAQHLDEQIAYQQAMKDILSEEQFTLFRELHAKKKRARARSNMLREGRSR